MKLRITEIKNALVANQLKNCILLLLLIGSCFVQNTNAQQLELLETETKSLNGGQTEVEINLYNTTSSYEKPLGNTIQSSFVASNCNTDSEILAYNVTKNDSLNAGDCQGNNALVICFKVNNFNSSTSTNNCQWLHGLVPDFGDCIVPVNQTQEGEPGVYITNFSNNSNTGIWQWFPDGVATYNDIPDGYYMPYEPVGAGWFYIYNLGSSSICNDPSNPNCTWGDGLTCSDENGMEWEVCFEAVVVCTELGQTLCEISFRTFGDGETGGWPQAGCESDEPWEYEFTRNCCEEPILTNIDFDFEICSGDLFEVELTSDMDPITTFEWTVSSNSNGATAGSGTTISDVLTNNSGVPVTVYYYVTPTCDQGCIGFTYTFAVTINPEIEIEVFSFSPICEGDCVEVIAEIVSNSPYAGCVWNTGQSDQPSITVCPPVGVTTYSVIVTEVNGCTGEGIGTVEVIPQLTVDVQGPADAVCESELGGGVFIFANTYGGSGDYIYEWSTGESSYFIEVVNPGTYTVTVTDAQFNCFPDVGSETINVYPNPYVYIFGPPVACDTEPVVCYNGQPEGGVWGGVADVNGCVYPSNLSSGFHTITYDYIDSNACEGSEVFQVEIITDTPAPLNISCFPDVNAIDFSWDAIAGVSYYLVNGVAQNETSFLVNNLNPGEDITITVEAIDGGPCGTSIETFTCSSLECPDLDIQISGIEYACQDGVIDQLFAWPQGGVFSGSCIIDTIFGFFDPVDAVPGWNDVSYTVVFQNCEYFETHSIWVEEPLMAPVISCESSVDGVIFSWTSVPGAIEYIVNGVSTNQTSIEFSNLQAGEEVSVTILAYGAGNCGPSTSESSCVAEDCPIITIQLQEVNPLCANEGTITLQSSEAGGLWSGPGIIDAVNGTFDPSQATLGTNTITYTLGSGNCIDANQLEIEVAEALIEPQIICNSSLDAVSFSWTEVAGASGYIVNGVLQNGNTFEATNLLPGEAITITVEAVGLGACGSAFAQSSCITEDCPVVSIQLESVPSLCQDNSGIITLEAILTGTNETGLWSGPGIIDPISGLFDPSDPAIVVGENMVSYIYENGNCSQSESLAIEVYFAPVADAGSLAILTCSESVVSLSGSGTGVPSWTGPGILSGAATNTPSIDAPGTYTLTMTDPVSGCQETDIVQVTENIDSPTAAIAEPDILTCTVLEITLNSTGSNSNNLIPNWEGPGISSANENMSNPEVDIPGLYTFTILNTDNGCWSEPVTVEVLQTIAPPLSEIIVYGALDCTTSGVIMEGALQANVAYEWTTPSGEVMTDLSFEATEEGSYMLLVTNLLSGCTATETAVLESLVALPITVAGSDQEINCYNELATLNGTASQTGIGLEYLWTGPTGSIIATPNQLETTVNISGLYTLTIFNSNNGCSSEDEVYVTADMVAPIVEAGDAQEFGCNTTNLILSGTVSADATSYQWTNTNQEVLSTDLVFDITDPGFYILQAMNSENGCSSIDDVLITENTNVPSDINYEAIGASCAGDNDAYLEIQGVVGGTAPYQYALNGEEFSGWNVWNSMDAGAYDLVVVDASGCTYAETLVVPETQPIVIDLGGDMELELGASHTIELLTNLSAEAIAKINWNPSELIDCMDDVCMEVTLAPMSTLDVEVQVVDTMGCMMEGSVQLRVDKNRDIFIPNAFSPNGDGSNDLFYPQGVDLSVVKIKRMAVFNRWGGTVFVNEDFPLNDPTTGWDGKYEGTVLNSGVFVYLMEVEYVDGVVEQLAGDVLLMR